jgi:Glycosyl hydrolase family 26
MNAPAKPGRSSAFGAITVIALLLVAICTMSMGTVTAATAPCSVLYGVYEPSTPWDTTMTAINRLDTAVNRHSSIIHWYSQWGDYGSGNFAAHQPSLLNAVRTYSSVGTTGSTPLINWDPWGPAPYSAGNNTFPLSRIAAGDFDPYIDSWAGGLKSFGANVMLDFAHEMDGSWYPWGYGVNGNTPSDYIAAFRHVHDRFVLAGATNVAFVWTVDIWNSAGVDPRSFYPGDSYVDWMAIDVFNWGASGGGWASLSQGLNATQVYSRLASLSGKPMMLAEWASTEPGPQDPPGVSKGQWILDAAQALTTEFPRIGAAVWFSDTGTAFALDSSSDSLAAAKSAFGGCP